MASCATVQQHMRDQRGLCTYGTLAPVPPHFLQITCLQLDDPVQCRVHWPMYCDLRINTMQYNATGRSSSTKLGANQRDEPANITALCHGCEQWVGHALHH